MNENIIQKLWPFLSKWFHNELLKQQQVLKGKQITKDMDLAARYYSAKMKEALEEPVKTEGRDD